MFKKAIFIEVLLLIGVIIFGLALRVENIQEWSNSKSIVLVDEEPIILNRDGYYFMSLAQDLLDGNYNEINEHRYVPERIERPQPPPLLSSMLAFLKRLLPVSLNWIAVTLPVFLSVSLAIPLFSWGKSLAGSFMGLSAATFAISSNYYIYRTQLGWVDTDCLNLVWPFLIAFFFMNFATKQNKTRYIHLLLGLLASYCFTLWWHTAPALTLLLSAFPLMIGLIFFYRPQKQESIVFGAISGLCIFIGLGYMGWAHLAQEAIKKASTLFGFFTNVAGERSFPIPADLITELQPASLESIAQATVGNTPMLIVALLGFVYLFWTHPKKMIFLAPLALLAVLPFFMGRRFIIYLVPICALGLGFLLQLMWDQRKSINPKSIKWVGGIPFAALGLIVYLNVVSTFKYVYWPVEKAEYISFVSDIAQKTPRDAIVWSWWDHGYTMLYWGQRSTIIDGGNPTGHLLMVTSIPYASSNYRMAANFMNFYVAHGIDGMNRIYSFFPGSKQQSLTFAKKLWMSGPKSSKKLLLENNEQHQMKATHKEILEFLFPANKRPIYLAIDPLLTEVSYWWYWLGTWNFNTLNGHHPVYKGFSQIRNDATNGEILKGSSDFRFSMKKGRLDYQFNGRQLYKFFPHISIVQSNVSKRVLFPNTNSMSIDVLLDTGYANITDREISNSVFQKLLMHRDSPLPYFQPVIQKGLHQLWKVEADNAEIELGAGVAPIRDDYPHVLATDSMNSPQHRKGMAPKASVNNPSSVK
jgi:hypothetical protein